MLLLCMAQNENNANKINMIFEEKRINKLQNVNPNKYKHPRNDGMQNA